MYQEVLAWVQEYGFWFYPITFLWAFIEGETFLIFAGFFASQDMLSLLPLILSAWLGTTIGDYCFFLLGRHYGKKLIARFPKLAKGQQEVIRWVSKHDVKFILTYRYIYGLRNISAIAIGNSNISNLRYFVLNMIGALIWAISFACGGYLFGDLLVKEGEDPVHSLMIGVLVILLVVVVLRYIHSRKAIREEQAADKNELPD